MKLVIAIVQDDDAMDLVEDLNEGGYRVTKLATTGGFLKAGNTTLLIGAEKEKVEDVLGVIKGKCSVRQEVMTTTQPILGNAGTFIPYPINVTVGGATIFIVDVDQFIRF